MPFAKSQAGSAHIWLAPSRNSNAKIKFARELVCNQDEDEEPRNSTTLEVVQGEAVKRRICDRAHRACAPSWQ